MIEFGSDFGCDHGDDHNIGGEPVWGLAVNEAVRDLLKGRANFIRKWRRNAFDSRRHGQRREPKL